MTLIPRRKAAEVLGVHVDTIDVWRKAKYLPAIAVNNGFLYDLNECIALAEKRNNKRAKERPKRGKKTEKPIKNKNFIMKKYDYDYYQIKVDLSDDLDSRLEKIMEEKGIKFKGVLLRELVMNFLKQVDENYKYIEEKEEEDYNISLFDDEFDWSGVGDIVTGRTLRRLEYIPKKDR